MSRSPDEVLAGIPDWAGARWEVLSGGLTNTSYRVFKGDRTGVLKLDDGPREEPFNTRAAEAEIQSVAANASLAAPVILAGAGVYFTEYVEGAAWARSNLTEDSEFDQLAVALKQLHALPPAGRIFDANAAARSYVEKMDGLDPAVVAHCMEIIWNTGLPRNLCCCHNDLVAENLILASRLMFIDWEYACDNDPLFDLATVIEDHQLSDAQLVRLLDAYFDGEGWQWRRALEQQRKLYRALLCLWMASRPDSDAVEVRSVVGRLTNRQADSRHRS